MSIDNFADQAFRTAAFEDRGERQIDVVEFCVIAKALGADPVVLFTQLAKNCPAKHQFDRTAFKRTF